MFDGMTYLEFFTKASDGSWSSTRRKIAAEFTRLASEKAVTYINYLAGKLQDASNPKIWRDWILADRLVRQLSLLGEISLTDVLGWFVGSTLARPMFKRRPGSRETSLFRADIPDIRRVLYATGNAPVSIIDRFAYERAGDRRGRYRSRIEVGKGNRLLLSSPSKIAPTVSGPFDITGQLTGSQLQERRGRIQAELARNEDAPSSVQTYLEEAWYSVPMHLALQLQKRREFTAAIDWFRTVYDYSHDAGEPADIYTGLVQDRDLKRKLSRPSDWLEDPLNPHAIAVNRLGAYTRFTLISIIRCLLDFADAEFTRDNAESVPLARTLYMTALKLLDLPETKQLLDRCEGPARLLDPPEWRDRFDDSSWDEHLSDLKGKIVEISDQKTIIDVSDEIREILESGRPPGKTYEGIRTRIDQVVSQKPLSPTVEDAIESQKKGLRQVHSALLSDADIVKAVEHVGGLAAQDFTGALTHVAEDAEGGDLPWLRGGLRTSADPSAPGAVVEPIVGDDAMRLDGLGRWDLFGEDMWRAFSESHPVDALEMARDFRFTFIPSLNPEFCIPPNPLLKMLRSRAELNLEKIRSCRNIAGQERQLPPYAAPTDATSGLPTIGAGGTIVVSEPSAPPPTLFRYEFLIQRARQIAGRASQMEAAFLAALEKRDNEYYKLMKAKQDVQLSRARVRLQDLRVREAEDNVVLAELQREQAEIQAEHYKYLLVQGKIRAEKAALKAQSAAVAHMHTAAGIKQAMTWGFGGVGEVGQALSATASLAQMHASFKRRRQRWQLQRNLARQDVRIGNQRITIAQDHVQIVKQERNIADMEADFAEDIVDFLATGQFTTADLYDWMSGVLERVYGYFLQEATVVAKMAERQLAFERQEAPPALIQSDYWEAPSDDIAAASDEGTDRRGLTGSARLLADIERLARHRIETEQRKLQLTKTISLSRLDPIAFQRFRETGMMPFETSLEMFDEDFPGHYLRLIKRVRVSTFALIPPTEGIHATLSSPGLSRVVTRREGSFRPVSVHRSPESIALSSPRDATGLFEMKPRQPELLLPFEGMGVDATWELRMPKASNRFDFQTMVDVLVAIDYTAIDSFDYRRQVIRELDRSISADQPFSFRHQLADQWYDLHHPERTATPMEVSFTIRRDDFPPNIENLKIEHLTLHFALANERSFEFPGTELRFREQGTDTTVSGEAPPIDGVISTRRASASDWRDNLILGDGLTRRSPFGEWTLVLPKEVEIKKLFKNEEIKDILFVITYEGRTPDWPT
jgi:hypothetical protein